MVIIVDWVNSSADGFLDVDDVMSEVLDIFLHLLLLSVTVGAVSVAMVEMGARLAKAIVDTVGLGAAVLGDGAFADSCRF